MQQVLSRFGIVEVARTGKISLKRGDQLLEMGGWGDGYSRSAKSNGARTVDSQPQEKADVYGGSDSKRGKA